MMCCDWIRAKGVTWTGVIIRDFTRRPAFISHHEFAMLTVHNWTRRPNKGFHFVFPVVPELSGGADRLAKLAEFVREWLKAHPSIDQEGYQLSVIKWQQAAGTRHSQLSA